MCYLIVFISLHLPESLKSNLPVIKTFTMSVQMTHSEGMDQEFVMKFRSLSTEAPSTLIKNTHYSLEPVVQWHCHWHSILGEEKFILGFPFFVLPVADLAGFLSHSIMSMTVQVFAGHSFCSHERKLKAHTFSAPEQLLMWEVKRLLDLPSASELTAWWCIRQEAVAPQGDQGAGGDNEGISCRIKAVRWRR